MKIETLPIYFVSYCTEDLASFYRDDRLKAPTILLKKMKRKATILRPNFFTIDLI